jgi:hypothetical protein
MRVATGFEVGRDLNRGNDRLHIRAGYIHLLQDGPLDALRGLGRGGGCLRNGHR